MLKSRIVQFPVILVVALHTHRTVGSFVHVNMASRTPAVRIGFDMASVVVASDAKGHGVSAFKPVSRFFGVIKFEIFFDDVPAIGHVTNSAVFGERFVGHQGTHFLIPHLLFGWSLRRLLFIGF